MRQLQLAVTALLGLVLTGAHGFVRRAPDTSQQGAACRGGSPRAPCLAAGPQDDDAGVSRREALVGAGLASLLGVVSGSVGAGAAPALAADDFGVKEDAPAVAQLPQSVLLNTLPVKDRYFRKLQALIEEVNVLRPYVSCQTGRDGAPSDAAARWAAVQSAAQEAKTVLSRHRYSFQPHFRADDKGELQILRAQQSEVLLSDLGKALKDLIEDSAALDQERVMAGQERALLLLGFIGELMLEGFPLQVPQDPALETLPALRGRALVNVVFRRKDRKAPPFSDFGGGAPNVTVVLDGFAAPLSAGNVLDLAMRGYYNNLPFNFSLLEASDTGPGVPVITGGRYETGFVDPITGRPRLLPLEVLRASGEKQVPSLAYGAARNSAVFTRDPPVLSFANANALALLHPADDANGANAEFFVVRAQPAAAKQCRPVPLAKRLDGRYSIFGWVVERSELLAQLAPGDVIESIEVLRGAENLVRAPTPSISKILSASGEEEED